ncbi:MAG: sulfite dehydrogenase [Gammaproteobacteria bacterium]
MKSDQNKRAALPAVATPKLPALPRRELLKYGFGLSAGATLATLLPEPVWADTASRLPADLPARPPWMNKPGEPFSNYGQPAEFESTVIRWISDNRNVPGNGVSWTPLHLLEGTIVPNGLHFERHHNGVPKIDPAEHQLLIHGAVERELIFNTEDLLRYPLQSRICFIECGGNSNALWNRTPIQSPVGYFNGLVSNSEWTGIPLKLLFDEAGLKTSAKWLIAEGADAFAMQNSIPLKLALDEGLLALYQNGERLRPENGYPMRLVVPGLEGVRNVKWVRRLMLADQPVMARNETARYTDLLTNGSARQFAFVINTRAVLTFPASGHTLPGPGVYEIKGLAWSGRGKISQVDVSTDNGVSWQTATLDTPVLPKAFTRFRLPWRWDGKPARLKARATDETGYVQPERSVLIAERGHNAFYHFNGILTFEIAADGSISHVYDEIADSHTGDDADGIDAGWF